MSPSPLTAGISEEEAQTRRHLLDHDAARELVGALAAVLLGDGDRLEPRLDQGVLRLDRVAALLVDLRGVRGDLLLRERPHRLAQRLVLVAEPVGVEVGIHGAQLNGTACHHSRRLLPCVP